MNTRSCIYSCTSSWWWVSTPEICRAAYRNVINWICHIFLESYWIKLKKIQVLLTLVFFCAYTVSSPHPSAFWALTYQKWTPTVACIAKDGFQIPQCTNFSNARWPIRDYTLVRLQFLNNQILLLLRWYFYRSKLQTWEWCYGWFLEERTSTMHFAIKTPKGQFPVARHVRLRYTCPIEEEPSIYT